MYEYVSKWKCLSVTCTRSWRTPRAPYWEVVLRGAYVCGFHAKPFFLLVHTLRVASKGIGRGKGRGRRENAADIQAGSD